MEYNFKFSEEQAQILIDGLSELPVKKSLSLIQNIQKQFAEQQTEQNAEVEQILTENK